MSEKTLRVTVSIGIALWPQNDAEAGDLIGLADVAMYQAKEAGDSCIRIFDQLRHGRI